jgi:dihydrofolate reductase
LDVNAPRRWRGRVFIGMSLDGFIARSDSNLDWLTEPPREVRHEHVNSDHRALDWETFMPQIDHIVMGRGTYEKVLTFESWPFTGQHVAVLSTALSASDDPRIMVVRSVKTATALLSRRHAREVYIDGGQTIHAFLEADLIDEITIGIAPVLIGTGIPLFGPRPHDIRLRLRATHATSGGMTLTTYEVVH